MKTIRPLVPSMTATASLFAGRILAKRFACAAASLLTACGTIDVPSTFPQAVQPERFGRCPKLASAYRNAGVKIDADGHQSNALLTRDVFELAADFAGDEPIRIESVPRVQKAWFGEYPFGRDVIVVSGSGERIHSSPRFIRGNGVPNGECSRGTMILDSSAASGAMPGIIASHVTRWRLADAMDGSLLVRREDIKVALILVIPYYKGSFDYFRFPPTHVGDRSLGRLPDIGIGGVSDVPASRSRLDHELR